MKNRLKKAQKKQQKGYVVVKIFPKNFGAQKVFKKLFNCIFQYYFQFFPNYMFSQKINKYTILIGQLLGIYLYLLSILGPKKFLI